MRALCDVVRYRLRGACVGDARSTVRSKTHADCFHLPERDTLTPQPAPLTTRRRDARGEFRAAPRLRSLSPTSPVGGTSLMDSRQTHSAPSRTKLAVRHVGGVVMAASLALLTLAGCGTTGGTSSQTTGSNCPSTATQDSWKLVTPGKLTIITNSPYAPAEFPDPNNPTKITGYDMDIAAALAKQMCLTLVINNTESFDSIIPDISGPALGQQPYDMSISSFTINATRQ